MKKILAILLAIMVLVVPMTVCVSAAGDINANEQRILTELKKEIKINSKTFIVPKEYVNQAENYFKTIDVTEAQADEIIGYINRGVGILQTSNKVNGTTDLKVLVKADKEEILDLGKKAVAVTGGVLTYNGSTVNIKNAAGQTVFDSAPIVKQTGTDVDFTAIIIAAVAVITLLGAAFIVSKKNGLFVK